MHNHEIVVITSITRYKHYNPTSNGLRQSRSEHRIILTTDCYPGIRFY